jgi:MFS family permease
MKKINKSLKILFLFNGVFVFAAMLLGPLYAVYVESIDKNILVVSITWAVFLASATFFTFIVSKKGDSVKEKEYLLMGGFLIRGLSWLLFIFVGSIFHLILVQIFLGIGEAFGSPSFDAIFAEHLDDGMQIKEYSSWKLIVNGATAIAAVIGGLIVVNFGFTTLFIIMSFLAFVSFFGVLFLPREAL